MASAPVSNTGGQSGHGSDLSQPGSQPGRGYSTHTDPEGSLHDTHAPTMYTNAAAEDADEPFPAAVELYKGALH